MAESGYELRARMLQLSKDMHSERMHAQNPKVPYTLDEVLKEAERLYAFVQTKTR